MPDRHGCGMQQSAHRGLHPMAVLMPSKNDSDAGSGIR